MKKLSGEKEEIIDYLEKEKTKIDKIIEKYLPRKVNKKWLKFVFGTPHYTYNTKAAQKALLEPIWNFLDRGGKRWRPVLFFLIFEAMGGKKEKLKDFSIILELIHEGSIIHDDIEDQGELRRGKPALHKIFGIDIALNAGSFLYFFPLVVLLKNKKIFNEKIINRIYDVYIQEMINIHFGQGTDIFWHKGRAKEIQEKEYLQMCAFKTGCLPRLSAKMAAIFAQADEKTVEKLGRFGESLGVAFQIQDDILDIVLEGKEREKFGKSFGNDIKEGKRTLMVIHTLKRANRKDREKLLEILDKHTDDIGEKTEAIEIIKKYGSIEYAKKVSQEIVRKSWEEIENILSHSLAKEKLKEFAHFLINRKL